MAASVPHSPDDDPVVEPAVARVAALDDYLAGFSPSPKMGVDTTGATDHETSPDAAVDDAGLLDTILLLRQAAAADGVVPAALPLPAPARIGRHAILRLAGTGGFATVWEGFDTVLRRPVAVKVRRPELLLSETVRRRFVREAEIAARLVHPHIVTTFEVGDEDGREFIAAEFCSGGSLADWLELRPGPLPPRIAARVVRALAGAVACAHDSGVIHRDIKPGNVLLLPVPAGSDPVIPAALGIPGESTGLTVKLGDFGLGMVREGFEDDDPLSRLTRTGTNVGTPAWMAPEQIDRAFGPVSPACDIHALGLLLDRMLTGRALRGSGTDAETYRHVLLDEPVSADRVVRGVPRDLAAIALKCIAKRPCDRYPSSSALADDLDRWLDGRPTLARPLAFATRAVRWVRRRPLIAAFASAAIVASLIAAWVGVERLRDASRAARQQIDLRRHEAVAELRRGFESLRSGNVASALDHLATTRELDPSLADSLAGRWLVRRTHAEKEILLAPNAAATAVKRPLDLYAIVLAPDGHTAAVAAADGSVRLVRDLDGTPSITSVLAHDEVNEVCFSPDGSMLASTGQNGVLRWWKVTPAGLVPAGEARPGVGPLYGVAFAPDGKTIATGGEDRIIWLVRLDAPDRAMELYSFESPPDHSPDVESIEFVDDGSLVASCGNRVVLLDRLTGRLIREFDLPVEYRGKAVFGTVVVSPDRTRVMACGSNSTAVAWDVATGERRRQIPNHPHWVHGAAFSSDGTRIATACRDGGLRVFDATTGVLLNRLFGHVGRVWSVVFEPAGTLLTSGADGTVRRWDPERPADAAIFRDFPTQSRSIIRLTEGVPSSLDGQRSIIAADYGQRLREIEPQAGVAQPFLPPEVAPVWSLAVDDRSSRIAVSFETPSPVTVFSSVSNQTATAVPVELPEGTDMAGAYVAWTPTGELIIHAMDGRLFLCAADLQSARAIGSTVGTVYWITTAPAGPARVAIAGDKAVIHALPASADDPAPAVAPIVLPVSEVTSSICFSPDGGLVVCGMRSGGVHLFDAKTGARRGTLAPQEHSIEAIAFASDGRFLLSMDRECLRVHDLATQTTFDEVRTGWRMCSLLIPASGDRILIGGQNTSTGRGALAVMDLSRP